MSNYIKRPFQKVKTEKVIERIYEKPEKEAEKEAFDIGTLAEAVAKAISLKLPSYQNTSDAKYIEDSFDESNTMNKLADQMIVDRGGNKSNFENLGNIKTTKKDQKDVDNTIDLLSGLDD